ncbi:MAG: hypothetical protein MAG431_01479 [Chloroflexi bacterium]|nr:hypothetical protein [Chloroflexota bacterium]
MSKGVRVYGCGGAGERGRWGAGVRGSGGAGVQGRWGMGAVAMLVLVIGWGMVTGCTTSPPTFVPPSPGSPTRRSERTPTPHGESPAPESTSPPSPTTKATVTATPEAAVLSPSPTSTSPENIEAILPVVSAKYIAPVENEARDVAQGLGFVGQNFEDPSNMCGPLAIAILQDAGVIDNYVDLSDVWLLDPSTNPQMFEVLFPRDKFEWFSFREPTHEFDFKAFPLQAGDFLYLYAGHSGSFQHMLTVTRVDEQGRAYTVTNINTEEGYVVEERMLYDPSDPEAGIFDRWADRAYLMLGRTGFGGFDLWRPKSKYPYYPGNAALAAEIDKVINFAGGKWHALVKSIPASEGETLSGGEVLYTRMADEKIHVTSVIKVPIAMMLFSSLEDQGLEEGEMASYIQSNGPNGRTYAQLVEAMLVKSEENATNTLYHYLNQEIDIDAKLKSWGVEGNVYHRKFTINDLAHLFEMLYLGEAVSETSRAIILEYMAEYTPNDDLRIGVLNNRLPNNFRIYNKRGSLTDPLVIADMAIIENPDGQDYLIALFASGDSQTTYEELESTLGEVVEVIWEHIEGIMSVMSDEENLLRTFGN